MTSDAEPPLAETIRKLTSSDAAAYWHLRLEALQTDPLAFGTTTEEHQASTVEHAAARLAAMPPQSFILGLFSDATLAGIATFARVTGEREGHKGHVYGVYIAVAHRGRGCGLRLLRTLLDLAAADPSLEQVLLAVRAGDFSSGRLYRRLGFQVFGTEPRALKCGAEYIEEDQMILRLR